MDAWPWQNGSHQISFTPGRILVFPGLVLIYIAVNVIDKKNVMERKSVVKRIIIYTYI